nr:hypothetical protein [Tanacetum cinerariifolium]
AKVKAVQDAAAAAHANDSETWPPSNLYDRFILSGGYHAVPHPVAGTFMPPKPDLVFHTPPSDENKHLAFNVTKDVLSFAQSPELVKSPRHSGLLSQPFIDNDSWPPSNLYDRFVPSGGYHAVPPPMTGTFMRPKPDLVFHTPPSDENEHLAFNSPELVKSPRHFGLISPPPIKFAQKSYASRDIYKLHAPMNHSKFPLHKVSAVAPSKSQPVLTAAARTISTVKTKFSKTRPNIAPYAVSTVNAAKPSVVSAAQHNHGKKVWRPKILVLDHAFRTTSASMTLKRFNYNDAVGKSKSIMAWVPKRN